MPWENDSEVVISSYLRFRGCAGNYLLLTLRLDHFRSSISKDAGTDRVTAGLSGSFSVQNSFILFEIANRKLIDLAANHEAAHFLLGAFFQGFLLFLLDIAILQMRFEKS